MNHRLPASKGIPIEAIDLRRTRSRDFVRSISERAKHLPDPERALLDEIYVNGKSIAAVAKLRDENVALLRRRVRRITTRVLTPRYRYVTEHQSAWRPTRRKVAGACVIEGLSIKDASIKLHLSTYLIRKHRDAIEALFESRPSQNRTR
ncbi:MAG: hypothetical protein COB69_06315 [Phycisphaera sp.]|nr:MAG: hypothetical protein COB69_06315 [Phycisphaera sp.]